MRKSLPLRLVIALGVVVLVAVAFSAVFAGIVMLFYYFPSAMLASCIVGIILYLVWEVAKDID